MRYFGGKNRIAKNLAPIINKYLEYSEIYYEPFCGGCSVSQYINDRKIRLLTDINPYLIALYKELQKGWIPPDKITKEEYNYIKNNKDEKPYLTGFVGFGCSFAGKWFGGYAKSENRNYCLNAKNSLLKKLKNIKTAKFFTYNYQELTPHDSVIYCDPPYINTTKYDYVGNFNHELFWDVMRKWSENNIVLISEYTAPNDFICINEINTKTDIKNKENKKSMRIEKLFKKGLTKLKTGAIID